jgi:uncharacterized protein DUF2865
MHFRVVMTALAVAALAAAGLPLTTHPSRHATEPEVTPPELIPAPQPATIGEMQPTQGWLWDLFTGRSREAPAENRRWPDPEERRRPDDGRGDQDFGQQRSDMSGTFRALCVRLCDGFPFPISHATTRDRFSANAKQCEQSCPGRSRLFVVRPSAEGPDDAADLQGQPYRKLPAAFRYRTEYDASCSCRGNPWDEEALARHRAYAEAEKAGKAKPVATAEKPAKSQEMSRRESRTPRSSRTARNSWQRDDDD